MRTVSTQPISRADWAAVSAGFAAFFEGAGAVEIDDERATFRAEITGFSIAADGTSESFMPLHTVALGWDEIVFDRTAFEVRLTGPAGAYTYVLPPDLR